MNLKNNSPNDPPPEDLSIDDHFKNMVKSKFVSIFFNNPKNRCPNCGWQNHTFSMVSSCPKCLKGVIYWQNKWISIDEFIDPDQLWFKDILHHYFLRNNKDYKSLETEENSRVHRIFQKMSFPREPEEFLGTISQNTLGQFSIFGAAGKAADKWFQMANELLISLDTMTERQSNALKEIYESGGRSMTQSDEELLKSLKDQFSAKPLLMVMAAYNAVNLEPENYQMWVHLLNGAIYSGFFGVYLRVKQYMQQHFEVYPWLPEFIRDVEGPNHELDPMQMDIIRYVMGSYQENSIQSKMSIISTFHIYTFLNRQKPVEYYNFLAIAHIFMGGTLYRKASNELTQVMDIHHTKKMERKIAEIAYAKLKKGYNEYPTPDNLSLNSKSIWITMIFSLINFHIYWGNFTEGENLIEKLSEILQSIQKENQEKEIFPQILSRIQTTLSKAKSDPNFQFHLFNVEHSSN